MKLTESRLRSIIREELTKLNEIFDFELLQNTEVTFLVHFPQQEFAEYQNIWPFVQEMKKNNVQVGNWSVTPESYERGDKIPTEAEIESFTVSGNAADLLHALSRLRNHPEVSQIHHYGEVGIEHRRLYIDAPMSEETFPPMRMTVKSVRGAMKDKHGHNSHRALIRQFGMEFGERSGGGRGKTMK